MIFRFDDVCGNSDIGKLNLMANAVRHVCPGATVEYAVSLFHTDMRSFNDRSAEFAFLPLWKAYSDHRRFYDVTRISLINAPNFVSVVSHGIVHADHRQMHADAQELSIVVSCSILNCKTFVPPFNKWDEDTERVCARHNIELQKFEDGWLGAEYNAFNPSHQLWYTHGFNWTSEKFEQWIGATK